MGQKGYQVESMAASSSDYWVRMGGKKKTADLTGVFSPASVPWVGTYRGVSGNAPDYIKNDPRYLVSVGNNRPVTDPAWPSDYYGTKTDKPAWLYPEDGRYVPSPYTDPAAYHESGDAWVADAAIEMMENEDWSGMFVTFSAMDKIGHMWGARWSTTCSTTRGTRTRCSTGSTCRSWPGTPTINSAASSTR